eukprot:CAMPEP_0185034382 /NCGR_PEP_ID=MMETSP1103-20130426/24225_1 /TAXON_ID=36769 /ORGANISM="Paraphysomonas bandaiensis, Strain Caron Lab Isolate" /LENGTH=138 /DNA_ID=CAMNT_0027571023 /DNA_START=86 /DNA_END=499 /DNA_ORIENTATION=-
MVSEGNNSNSRAKPNGDPKQSMRGFLSDGSASKSSNGSRDAKHIMKSFVQKGADSDTHKSPMQLDDTAFSRDCYLKLMNHPALSQSYVTIVDRTLTLEVFATDHIQKASLKNTVTHNKRVNSKCGEEIKDNDESSLHW